MADVRRQILISKLHGEGTFQLGEFLLKSGVISPIYVDLRVLISSPSILALTADTLSSLVTELLRTSEFDYIVGVPYGAISLATLVSHSLRKPMLMKRKEAKNYGKKQMIEGRFEPGKRALIIEDVVTSGQSILETVDELKKAGLTCTDVLCVLDREQGGVARLIAAGITLHSVLDFLLHQGIIDEARRDDIEKKLNAAPTTSVQRPEIKLTGSAAKWSLVEREAILSKNPLNKSLLDIIMRKKTNLCLAADSISSTAILEMAEKAGDHICALKLHHDIVKGFSLRTVNDLHRIAERKGFLIVEDRKYADTGNTMMMQLTGGDTPVSEWAHAVTVHSISGAESITALQPVVESDDSKLLGCLLIAQLSTENALTNLPGYAAGVSMQKTDDGLGQKWRSVEKAVVEDGCDIIVVGRGIYQAEDITAEASRYARAGWEALNKR